MKTLLVAINAKFIHSNLAIRYIKSYYQQEENKNGPEILEFSINQQMDYILNEIMERQADVVAFSAYLWNIDMIRNLGRAMKLIDEKIKIIVGGPEVMYTSIDEMKDYTFIDYIINGEGEESFRQLINYIERNALISKDVSCKKNGPVVENKGLINQEHAYPCKGITYRDRFGNPMMAPAVMGLDLAKLPFPYSDDLKDLEHRILYYETSRGCPFHCQYCLSSIEKGVRFRPLHMVFKELDFFLSRQVRQVKLVDRTFNTRKDHALGIMEYIIEHDNGVTNFHFEVAPELLGDDFIACLMKARKGLFQLEVGVQSTNEKTLNIIKRKNNLKVIKDAVTQVHAIGNTHMHLDLIAGLPAEDYNSFANSFDFVYELGPDQLQLGFLKVLKGSGMMDLLNTYGIVYRQYTPYEVLKTQAISYKDLNRLKMVEEMVELFYNSGQFRISMNHYLQGFSSAFKGFEELADQWVTRGFLHYKHQKLDLYDFMKDVTGLSRLLKYDYCLNEKPRKKRDWMDYQFIEASKQKIILDGLQDNGIWLEEGHGFTTKQLSRMYHMDRVDQDDISLILPEVTVVELSHPDMTGDYVVINYNRRDFIHNNGQAVVVKFS